MNAGRAWLASRGLIARANFAAALAGGRTLGCAEPFDALALASRHGCGGNPDELLAWFSCLLLGRELDAEVRDRMLASVKLLIAPELARRLITLVLTTPEAQLN